jgi:hypothetical protein
MSLFSFFFAQSRLFHVYFLYPFALFLFVFIPSFILLFIFSFIYYFPFCLPSFHSVTVFNHISTLSCFVRHFRCLSILAPIFPLRLTYLTFLLSRVSMSFLGLNRGVSLIVEVSTPDVFRSVPAVVFPYKAAWPLSTSQKRMSLAKFLS